MRNRNIPGRRFRKNHWPARITGSASTTSVTRKSKTACRVGCDDHNGSSQPQECFFHWRRSKARRRSVGNSCTTGSIRYDWKIIASGPFIGRKNTLGNRATSKTRTFCRFGLLLRFALASRSIGLGRLKVSAAVDRNLGFSRLPLGISWKFLKIREEFHCFDLDLFCARISHLDCDVHVAIIFQIRPPVK